VKLVPNYNTSKAKFTNHDEILQLCTTIDCQYINRRSVLLWLCFV